MARKNGGRRDNNNISNYQLPRRPSLNWNYVALNREIKNFKKESWRDYEDRRRFHPLQASAPALSINQRRSLLTLVQRPAARNPSQLNSGYSPVPQNIFKQTKAAITFARPRRVLICLRRAVRRQIMHAFGHAGKGGQKSPIKNWSSAISCKG